MLKKESFFFNHVLFSKECFEYYIPLYYFFIHDMHVLLYNCVTDIIKQTQNTENFKWVK